MLNKAIILATNAHKGQKDKAGEHYILHPLRVMLHCTDEKSRICAVLHDVIEDTSITLLDLKKEGFCEDIIYTIALLTKTPEECYFSYIKKILKNATACTVKLLDIEDNLDKTRIKNPQKKDYDRWEKYEKAKQMILYAMEQKKKPSE